MCISLYIAAYARVKCVSLPYLYFLFQISHVSLHSLIHFLTRLFFSMFGQLHTYTPFLQVYRKKQMDTLEAPDTFPVPGGDIVVIDDTELFLVGFQIADKAIFFQ